MVKLSDFSFNFPEDSVSLFRLSNLITLNDLTPGETYNITIEVVGEGSNPHVRRAADEIPLPPAALVEKSAQRTFESHTLTVHWEKTGFYKVIHFVMTNISWKKAKKSKGKKVKRTCFLFTLSGRSIHFSNFYKFNFQKSFQKKMVPVEAPVVGSQEKNVKKQFVSVAKTYFVPPRRDCLNFLHAAWKHAG